MALSEQKKQLMGKRILLSRNRILCNHGFYGLLLMHMRFVLDEKCDTAYTDGRCIAFSPTFLDSLSESELDFVMMHEILHVALRHCARGERLDRERFNVACDVVVNSNILKTNGMRLSSITLMNHGESMHLTPSNREGYLYSAEEVYEMLPRNVGKEYDGGIPIPDGGLGDGDSSAGTRKSSREQTDRKPLRGGYSTWDNHGRWEIGARDEELQEIWLKRLSDAATVVSVTDPDNSNGSVPLGAERILKELRKPQTDWRTILNEFVQEEICDYSFSPPDRRFAESPFFLPDFNETDFKVENVLFMIDTSASITDEMIAVAYGEIKGAIDQFDGKLCGYLGFFDAAVYEPKPFDSVRDVMAIRPKGGGGTDFYAVFRYVFSKMEQPPASIVILTDGYADFPPPSAAKEIPVLWLLNNKEVEPPWGKIARVEV